MKATGMVRNVDNLGRVVIPKEIRRTLGIDELDPVEIFVDGDKVVLRKYQPGCYTCGSVESEVEHFYGHIICHKCIKDIGKHTSRIVQATEKEEV